MFRSPNFPNELDAKPRLSPEMSLNLFVGHQILDQDPFFHTLRFKELCFMTLEVALTEKIIFGQSWKYSDNF